MLTRRPRPTTSRITHQIRSRVIASRVASRLQTACTRHRAGRGGAGGQSTCLTLGSHFDAFFHHVHHVICMASLPLLWATSAGQEARPPRPRPSLCKSMLGCFALAASPHPSTGSALTCPLPCWLAARLHPAGPGQALGKGHSGAAWRVPASQQKQHLVMLSLSGPC